MNFLTRYFRRRLVYSSYDAVQTAQIRRALQEEGVQYWLKQRTDDLIGPQRLAGGAVPFKMKAATEYLLYVDKDDVELAEYLAQGGRL